MGGGGGGRPSRTGRPSVCGPETTGDDGIVGCGSSAGLDSTSSVGSVMSRFVSTDSGNSSGVALSHLRFPTIMLSVYLNQVGTGPFLSNDAPNDHSFSRGNCILMASPSSNFGSSCE